MLVAVVVSSVAVAGSFAVFLLAGPRAPPGPCGPAGFAFLVTGPDGSAYLAGPTGRSNGTLWYNLTFLHCAGPSETGNLSIAVVDGACGPVPGVSGLSLSDPHGLVFASENASTRTWTFGGTSPLPATGGISIVSRANLSMDELVVSLRDTGEPVGTSTFGDANAWACPRA